MNNFIKFVYFNTTPTRELVPTMWAFFIGGLTAKVSLFDGSIILFAIYYAIAVMIVLGINFLIRDFSKPEEDESEAKNERL